MENILLFVQIFYIFIIFLVFESTQHSWFILNLDMVFSQTIGNQYSFLILISLFRHQCKHWTSYQHEGPLGIRTLKLNDSSWEN